MRSSKHTNINKFVGDYKTEMDEYNTLRRFIQSNILTDIHSDVERQYIDDEPTVGERTVTLNRKLDSIEKKIDMVSRQQIETRMDIAKASTISQSSFKVITELLNTYTNQILNIFFSAIGVFIVLLLASGMMLDRILIAPDFGLSILIITSVFWLMNYLDLKEKRAKEK